MIRRLVVGAAALATFGCGAAQPPAAPAAGARAEAAKAGPARPTSPEDELMARVDAMGRADSLRVRHANATRRPRVRPVSFDLAALPLVKMPPITRPEDATPVPGQPTPPPPKNLGAPAVDLVVEPNEGQPLPPEHAVKLSVREASPGATGLGQIALWDHLRRGRNSGSGPQVVERCGPSYGAPHAVSNRFTELRWERIRLVDGGAAEVVVSQGLFDRFKCEPFVTSRTTVKPAPVLPGGLLFGFRACPAKCAGVESLVLVYPRARGTAANSLGADPREQLGSFSIVSIPLQKGGGGSMVAAITGQDLSVWHKALARVEQPPITNQILIGIEVTQSVSDPEPISIAYMDAIDDKGGDLAEETREQVIQRLARALLEAAENKK